MSLVAGNHVSKPTESEPDPPMIAVDPAYPRSQVLDDKTANQQIEWTEESIKECNIFYEGSKMVFLITLWGGAQQYLLKALQVQQLTVARTVCGFNSWGWSKKKLLDKVG